MLSAVSLTGLLGFEDLAAFVVSAFGTHAVRHFLLVAVGTLRQRVGSEKIVGAATSGASLGVPPFWIRHGSRFLTSAVSYVHAGDAACCVSTCGRGGPAQIYFNLSLMSASAAQRGSGGCSSQAHGSTFKFFPHPGQKPRQLSLHTVLSGNANSICSRKTSSSWIPSPE